MGCCKWTAQDSIYYDTMGETFDQMSLRSQKTQNSALPEMPGGKDMPQVQEKR